MIFKENLERISHKIDDLQTRFNQERNEFKEALFKELHEEINHLNWHVESSENNEDVLRGMFPRIMETCNFRTTLTVQGLRVLSTKTISRNHKLQIVLVRVEALTPISKINGEERGPLERNIGIVLILLKETVADVGV
jgi:hypothetical protein